MILELFFLAGNAYLADCGSGCWKQEPLPYHKESQSHETGIGVRYKNVELAYRDLGTLKVNGLFVSDDAYDAKKKCFKKEPEQIFFSDAQEHTTGISLVYAPRFQNGKFSVQPSVGIMLVHQSESVTNYHTENTIRSYPTTNYRNTAVGTSMSRQEFSSSHRLTPMVGLLAQYHFNEKVSVGISYDYITNPRYVNSINGSGVSLVAGQVRVAF